MVTQTHHFRVLQTNSTRFFKQISTINSMIFKTMDNELKVFGKTILTTTEHLKNLETVNATVYNKNGQFNLQGLSINTSQSVGNFTKLNNAFKSYNGNLTKSTQLQNAYIKAVGNQNGALGNYLAGLNGAKASMGGYIKSLIGAKAATIGLQVASTLLNAALSLGLSLALSAIVSGITHLVNKEKEAREQAIENAQTAKEEADNLTELLNKYNQLSEEVKTNTGVKDDLLETQGELLESLGIEQSQLDGLIKKYGDLNTAINKVTLDSLNDAQADLMVAVDARKKELINVGKDYKHWFSLTDRNLISTGGEESKQAYDILAKAGVISQGSVGTGGGVFTLVGDDKTVDGILENYQKLKEAQTALNEAVSNGEISKEDMGSNPLYKAINSRLDELKTAVDNYNSAIKDVNENSANQEIISNLIGKDLPQTEEEFETFKQSLIDSAQASNNFIGSQEDIKNSIIDALAEMPEFEKYFEGLAQAESDVQHETPTSFEIPDAETLKQQISDLNSAIDSIQSAYDTLNSAVEEYNSNGGQLSIDTIQSLLSLSDEYLACLQVENGQLSLNADAMAQLAQAKLDDAQATAVTQAMTELQAIANGEAAQSTANYITGNAALMDSLAQLSGSYEGVAQAAMTAAQAQELSAQISAASAKDKTATENVMKGLDTKLKLIQSTKNAISAGNFASVSKKTSKSGSSSKSSKDELKEQFQVEYDLLKHNLEMETITEKEYYDGVQALNEKYFAGKKEYLDEYRKYEEEVYKGLKSYYKSYCDDMMNYYDKKLDASKMSYKEYCDSVSKMLADMHNSGKISDKDWYDYTKTMLEKQKDAYDRALSAITRRLQKEIDAWQAKIDALNDQNDILNDQKDNYDKILSAVSNVYDKEIDRLNEQKDLLQDQIDALNDKNDALDLQYRKEQALYALQKAQQQRTRKLYVEGKGYIYDTDNEAIRDAQKDLDDITNEELINSLQKEQDKIQESIDILEKYKEKWNEIPDAWNKAVSEQLAIELWGQEYEKLILMNRTSDIENFKTKYLKIQSQINDNEQLIKSYEEKVEYYTKLKEQWQSLTDEYSNSVDDMYAKMLLGQSWEADVLNGRLSTLNDFRNQYNDIQKSISDMAWQSANAQISALNAVKAAEATKAQTSGGSNGYSGSSGTTTSVGGNTSGGSGLTAAQKYQVRLAGTVIVIYEGSSETDLRNWITRNNYIGVSRTIQNNIIIYFAKKKEKKYIGQVYKTSGQASSQIGMLGGVGYDKVSGGYRVYKYAKGTDNAKKGWNIVSEENPELIVGNNGEIDLAKGEQFYNFEGGETVIPANETKEILKNQGNVEPLSDSDVITRKDGSILKPIHYEYENILTNFIKDNPDYMYSMNTMSDNMCRDLFKNAENVNYDNRSVDNRVSIGEIHLHEVQNVDQFARELDRQLAGIVDQKLSRRKR